VSGSAVKSISDAAGGCAGICEIGPGPGVLTQALCEKAERVIAIELDPRMGELLAESAPTAEVRHLDALQIDLSALMQELPSPRAIVSNMPYYITGPLLQRVADARGSIDRAVLMMQREVAIRVIARAGESERGSLSVYLQSLFEIRALVQVPAGAFLPPPKVDSTVLVFTPRAVEYDDWYFRLIRFGFTQPRKTLANNLANGLHRSRDEIVEVLESMDLWEKTRAQEVTEAQWLQLSQTLVP